MRSKFCFLGDSGHGQDELWRQEEPGFVYMNSVAIAGVEEKGGGSPLQARIFHGLAFTAQDCPQSIQSRLQEASRRNEGAPLRLSFFHDL